MGSTRANLSWQMGAMRFFRPMCSCGEFFQTVYPRGVWNFNFLCYRGLNFGDPWVGSYNIDHVLLLSICTFKFATTFCLYMKSRVHGVWFFKLMVPLVFKVELWIPWSLTYTWWWVSRRPKFGYGPFIENREEFKFQISTSIYSHSK